MLALQAKMLRFVEVVGGQVAAAKALGVSQNTISQMCMGRLTAWRIDICSRVVDGTANQPRAERITAEDFHEHARAVIEERDRIEAARGGKTEAPRGPPKADRGEARNPHKAAVEGGPTEAGGRQGRARRTAGE